MARSQGCHGLARVASGRGALAIDPSFARHSYTHGILGESGEYDVMWCNKGVSLAMLGRLDEAVAAFDHALALAPRHFYSWRGKGFALFLRHDYEAALACFERATTLDPEIAGGWMGRGEAFDQLNRPDEALVAFDRALALDGSSASAWEDSVQ